MKEKYFAIVVKKTKKKKTCFGLRTTSLMLLKNVNAERSLKSGKSKRNPITIKQQIKKPESDRRRGTVSYCSDWVSPLPFDTIRRGWGTYSNLATHWRFKSFGGEIIGLWASNIWNRIERSFPQGGRF